MLSRRWGIKAKQVEPCDSLNMDEIFPIVTGYVMSRVVVCICRLNFIVWSLDLCVTVTCFTSFVKLSWFRFLTVFLADEFYLTPIHKFHKFYRYKRFQNNYQRYSDWPRNSTKLQGEVNKLSHILLCWEVKLIRTGSLENIQLRVICSALNKYL